MKHSGKEPISQLGHSRDFSRNNDERKTPYALTPYALRLLILEKPQNDLVYHSVYCRCRCVAVGDDRKDEVFIFVSRHVSGQASDTCYCPCLCPYETGCTRTFHPA